LWKEEYPSETRTNCVRVASKFGERPYLEQWLEILGTLSEEQMLFFQGAKTITVWHRKRSLALSLLGVEDFF
jgi:hypothetical protein